MGRPEIEDPKSYELDFSAEQIIYVPPEHHYIYNLQVKHTSISNIYMLINSSIESVYNRNSLCVHPLRKNVHPYSIYLDGLPIQASNNHVLTAEKIKLRLLAPLIPISLEYTFWKKEVKEVLNNRVYTETITIREREECDIKIKIVSSAKFIKQPANAKHESQLVILYMPSRTERLDEKIVLKLLEKGVVFVQITNCRGIFGSNMIELMRGSKENF